MSTIHELSSLMTLPEMDVFGVPPTQLMIERDVQTEHRPISTLSNSTNTIEFEVHTGLNEYINLSKSELYLCLKFKLQKSTVSTTPEVKQEDWKLISPINYLMHSFIKQIDVNIGQTTVTTSSVNYSYVSYIDTLLNSNRDARKTHLETAFWHKDETPMDSVNEIRSSRIRPSGNSLSDGCEVEMYGNLHIDLASQVKSLLGGVTLNIKIYPQDPKFYLIYDKTLIPTVEIMDVRLFMHKSIVNPQVVVAHNRALESANARYFITRKEVKTSIIAKDTLDCYLNNVINGVIPRKIYIGFVSNEAYNGSYNMNPFYFKNYNIRHIACYVDGTQYPHRPYTPDFANKKYMREYFGLFETANQIKHSTDIDITREEYAEGYTLFGFNFTPDLSDGVAKSGYVSTVVRGNLRVELKFAYPIQETVTAIIFCEYDSCVEIESSRFAIKNFQ
ncbi:uncharacterized protein F54H12.2-like [Oppia nitens]|uniref:uncharacterized protein F54H12.2-like n=1 Tax=Oppia nitens TaxID=1686743 RepID=UPI0023D9D5ED|nr:uncharacterized protein F54H12.2-like [Oppia nitens]